MFSLSLPHSSGEVWRVTETFGSTYHQFRPDRYSVDSGQSTSQRRWPRSIRRVSSLAIPAFVASAASTLSLQDDILSDCAKSDSVFLLSYLSDWSTKFGDTSDVLPTKQPTFWDRPGVLEDKALLEASLISDLCTRPGIVSRSFFTA